MQFVCIEITPAFVSVIELFIILSVFSDYSLNITMLYSFSFYQYVLKGYVIFCIIRTANPSSTLELRTLHADSMTHNEWLR